MAGAARRPGKLLGQVLLEKGLITQRQLSDALKARRRLPKKLGRILVEMGYVSEEDMLRSSAEQFGLPFPAAFLWLFSQRARGREHRGSTSV